MGRALSLDELLMSTHRIPNLVRIRWRQHEGAAIFDAIFWWLTAR